MLLWAGHWEKTYEVNAGISFFMDKIYKSYQQKLGQLADNVWAKVESMTKLLIGLDYNKLTGPYQQHSVKLQYTFGSNVDRSSAFREHHSLLFPPKWCHSPAKNGKILQKIQISKERHSCLWYNNMVSICSFSFCWYLLK